MSSSSSSFTVPSIFSLKGQTALVTGGSRGIGQAMAIALAEAGADIVLIQRQRDNNQSTSTKTAVEALGRRCSIHKGDLASRDSIEAALTDILNTHAPIRILVNCGGVQRRHAPTEFPFDDWDAVMDVNLNAVFQLCRDVGAHMLAQPPIDYSPSSSSSSAASSASDSQPSARRGSIINVASLLSFQGGLNVPAYAASKGGVALLTKSLSNSWAGRGVTVNAIAPGYIDTEMNDALISDEKRAAAILDRIPMGRWGAPDDFKGAVVFLASRASAYVSGEILTVDGGWMGR